MLTTGLALRVLSAVVVTVPRARPRRWPQSMVTALPEIIDAIECDGCAGMVQERLRRRDRWTGHLTRMIWARWTARPHVSGGSSRAVVQMTRFDLCCGMDPRPGDVGRGWRGDRRGDDLQGAASGVGSQVVADAVEEED